jgi:hypothetical protein
MKKMAAGAFKTNCLAVMDEVQAKLVPISTGTDEIYNFLGGRGATIGDVVSPVISPEEWGELK